MGVDKVAVRRERRRTYTHRPQKDDVFRLREVNCRLLRACFFVCIAGDALRFCTVHNLCTLIRCGNCLDRTDS